MQPAQSWLGVRPLRPESETAIALPPPLPYVVSSPANLLYICKFGLTAQQQQHEDALTFELTRQKLAVAVQRAGAVEPH